MKNKTNNISVSQNHAPHAIDTYSMEQSPSWEAKTSWAIDTLLTAETPYIFILEVLGSNNGRDIKYSGVSNFPSPSRQKLVQYHSTHNRFFHKYFQFPVHQPSFSSTTLLRDSHNIFQ
jgi:hypothetical protein